MARQSSLLKMPGATSISRGSMWNTVVWFHSPPVRVVWPAAGEKAIYHAGYLAYAAAVTTLGAAAMASPDDIFPDVAKDVPVRGAPGAGDPSDNRPDT